MKITQQQLESYLWGAAVLLRGTIDAGDYKQFIFPLLFYKRLCDVFDEETLTALRDSGGDEHFALFPENHRFLVPADAHWREVRKVNRDVGRALQTAMRAIETANPDKLYGIFGDAQWTNKDRLSDAMLRDLVEHFSALELAVANLPEDELGQGYEFLIKKFADDSGHTAAEFYTNRTVVHLMTEMLDVQPGESVYDPTCGSGGMLLSCIAHLRNLKKEWRNVRLYGQERNLMTSSIARMNCFLHGIEDFHIERGDTLAEPKFVEGDRLRRFDVVLANPPYSIKQWNREAFAADPWGRNIFGVPPQSIADYAFQQHILQSLKAESGRCAVLWPHGVLFRDAEAEIRRKMIEADLIECIVGLGPNLFYNSSMPSCIVICRTAKSKARKGKILLINAVNEVVRERAQSFLKDTHLSRIVDAYRAFEPEEHFARIVTIDEVRTNNGNLNLQFYVAPATSVRVSTTNREKAVTDAITNWIASGTLATDALTRLTGKGNQTATRRNLQVGNTKHLLDGRSSWERIRLGDLLEKTEVVERHPLAAGFERYLMVEHMDANRIRIQRWGNIADDDIPPTFYKVFRKGQILYPTRNPHLRRAAVAGFEGICGEKTLTLSVRDGFDASFVPWVLQSEPFIEFATSRKIGSTNPHVRWRDIAEFEFDLPPLAQQRRIAEIFWAIDEALESLLTARVALLNQTNAIITAFIAEQSSTAGPLGTYLSEIQYGSSNKSILHPEDGLLPVLRIPNVIRGEIDFTDLVWAEPTPENEKFQLEKGDLLIVRTNGNPDYVGRTAVFDTTKYKQCIFASYLIRLKPRSEKLLPHFLHAMLGSDHVKAEIRKQIKSSAGNYNLNTEGIRNLNVPIPSLDIQQRLLSKLADLNASNSAVVEYSNSVRRCGRELSNLLLI